MKADSPQPSPVTHDTKAKRFDTPGGGYLTYGIEGDRFIALHTVVPEELRGQGIAARLTEAALQYAKENHYTVIPQCSYVAVYLERKSRQSHPRTS
ncbi:MAG: GNAT family N-acetyltransferase [Puniceicoccales bacterium]